MTLPVRVTDAPLVLGPMPANLRMTAVDECVMRAPLARVFAVSADVERWPTLLRHYRYVRFLDRRRDGGGIVDMSANRPFGVVMWPTWWRSQMSVVAPGEGRPPSIRFTHIGGVTTGMDVEWTFDERPGGTHVRITHVWDGPPVPVLGIVAATVVIGPVFVSGIASRTLAGLAMAAERQG